MNYITCILVNVGAYEDAQHFPAVSWTHPLLLGLLALLCAMPASPARAGGPGPNAGDCPPEGQPTCGDPINPATGNVYETVTDFTTGGQNPLAIIRYYNSEVGVRGGSFRNWLWTYDRSLSISPTEVDAFRADGKDINFFPDGSGGWKGLSDLDLRLTHTGSIWTLTDWDDNVETYTVINGGFFGLLTSNQSPRWVHANIALQRECPPSADFGDRFLREDINYCLWRQWAH
jgi:Domain of unknown function (DUF6531)